MRAPVSHVFMTTDAVGGVWTYAMDLAAGLSGYGVRTTLAVLGPPPHAEQRDMAAAVPGLSILETGLPLEWTAPDAKTAKSAAAALGGLARASGADLIHLNNPALAADAAFDAPIVGLCHSDLATWWAAVRGAEPAPADFRWRTTLLRRGYAACDVLLAPTAAFASDTARVYGVRPKVIRNGRSPAARHPRPGGRDRLVLTSGRLWDEGKNVETLDRAAARLDAPVVALGALAGPNGQHASLEHARPAGRVSNEEVAAALAGAPVFCSLALYEPFGLGVLEAAQAGCALVLSDLPSFRELWNGAAVFTPARDPEAAATILRALLDSPEEAARLGTAAAERARTYTVEAMVAGVLDAYAQLLAGEAEVAA